MLLSVIDALIINFKRSACDLLHMICKAVDLIWPAVNKLSVHNIDRMQ